MSVKNFCQATDVGLMRENNEDAVLSNSEAGLWLVADGMGGHAAGEVASQITSEVINQKVLSGEGLQRAILSAHEAIHAAVESGAGKYGMGSTVVALKSTGPKYQIAWVGDSRAYLYSDSTPLTALSTDHSYVQMLFQSGMITAAEMENHPERNIITQCLGSNDTEEIIVDVVSGQWRSGDVILLCSDGLSDIVSEQAICSILEQSDSLSVAVERLIESALNNGGKDNISVVLVGAPAGIASPFKVISGWLSRLSAAFRS